jgi:hypothetical protein
MKKHSSNNPVNHLDHSREIQRKIYGKMSYAEKWTEAMRLRTAAMSMKKAFLLSRHPDWSSEQIDLELRKIFLYASN